MGTCGGKSASTSRYYSFTSRDCKDLGLLDFKINIKECIITNNTSTHSIITDIQYIDIN